MAEARVPLVPWDLILHIAHFVPTTQLYPLLLTSKALHTVAERLLYRHVHLSNCPHRSVHFFRTVLECPDIARLVISFEAAEDYVSRKGPLGRVLALFGGQQPASKRPTVYQNFMGVVTERLCNVEAISLQARTPHFTDWLVRLHSITRFRLRCRVGEHGLDSYGTLFDMLPLVTHLELPFTMAYAPLADIRPDHLPLLEELACRTLIAAKLVPNKPVKKLFLIFPFHWEPLPSLHELMHALSRSSVRVTVLGLTVRWAWAGEMARLVHETGLFLPDLEELYLTLSFFPTQTHMLREFLAALPFDLGAFHSLRILDFNGSLSDGIGYFDRDRTGLSTMYTPVLNTWSKHCPSLTKVVFPNGTIWTQGDGKWRCENLLSSNRLESTFDRPRVGRIRYVGEWVDEPTFERDTAKEWPDSPKWATL